MRKTVTLYPSKDHFQRTTDRQVPLTWAAAYLNTLMKDIPESELPTAMCTWPPTVTYEHTLSESEQLAERLARVRAVLGNLGRDRALTEEQLSALRAAAGF